MSKVLCALFWNLHSLPFFPLSLLEGKFQNKTCTQPLTNLSPVKCQRRQRACYLLQRQFHFRAGVKMKTFSLFVSDLHRSLQLNEKRRRLRQFQLLKLGSTNMRTVWFGQIWSDLILVPVGLNIIAGSSPSLMCYLAIFDVYVGSFVASKCGRTFSYNC